MSVTAAGGVTITTGGPNSHGFGNVGGNVTITHQHAPPAEQPRKEAGGYRLTRESLAGLERIMRGASGAPTIDDLLEGRSVPRGQCPPMPVWQALALIADRIGDHEEGSPRARQELRQAAAEGRVEVWGQQDIPPAHMQDNRHKQIWTPIEPDYWDDYELNLLSTREEDDDKWHTEEEELPGRRGNRYWSLRVDHNEINRRWPSPPTTTAERFSATNPPAKPNMNLNELLSRVYAAHRPLPEDNLGKAKVWRKIDFEIMDQIVENNLHVWGRYMDRAREPIRMESLRKGKLDHKAGTFSVPSIDSVRPMVFEDLRFNREEIDQIWPKP